MLCTTLQKTSRVRKPEMWFEAETGLTSLDPAWHTSTQTLSLHVLNIKSDCIFIWNEDASLNRSAVAMATTRHVTRCVEDSVWKETQFKDTSVCRKGWAVQLQQCAAEIGFGVESVQRPGGVPSPPSACALLQPRSSCRMRRTSTSDGRARRNAALDLSTAPRGICRR